MTSYSQSSHRHYPRHNEENKIEMKKKSPSDLISLFVSLPFARIIVVHAHTYTMIIYDLNAIDYN